jgi:hypothetical protein
MTRGSWRNKLVEERLIARIDRGRERGPAGADLDESVKMRLHECKVGDWVRQVMAGAGNLGPNLRVIDPKAGILETRHGVRARISPRTQVMVQPR